MSRRSPIDCNQRAKSGRIAADSATITTGTAARHSAPRQPEAAQTLVCRGIRACWTASSGTTGYLRQMPELTAAVIDAETSRELRRSVLRPGLPVGSTLPGDTDPGVVHLGAFAGSRLVSACLIFPEPCEWRPGDHAWRLRGMATDPGHRGGGAGSALLAEAGRVARADSATILWCLARETAIGFYARNGWQENGKLFDTELGPHLRMWLELGSRPTS